MVIFSYSKGNALINTLMHLILSHKYLLVVSHEWLESETRQVSYIDHSVLCLTSVQHETLWVSEANRVHVFAGDVFKFPVNNI